MSLLDTHGETFPPQLYPVLESVLGLAKAKMVLQSVVRMNKQYDPDNIMYSNCKPEHRKKMWITTQVLLEVQLIESMATAMQISEALKPYLDSWLKGSEDSAVSVGTSTETEGLNTAVVEVFSLVADSINQHPAAITIMRASKDMMMTPKSVNKNEYPFSEVPARVHKYMNTIMLMLQALDKGLSKEQAQVIKWEIRAAATKGKQGDKMRWTEQCLECE